MASFAKITLEEAAPQVRCWHEKQIVNMQNHLHPIHNFAAAIRMSSVESFDPLEYNSLAKLYTDATTLAA